MPGDTRRVSKSVDKDCAVCMSPNIAMQLPEHFVQYRLPSLVWTFVPGRSRGIRGVPSVLIESTDRKVPSRVRSSR